MMQSPPFNFYGSQMEVSPHVQHHSQPNVSIRNSGENGAQTVQTQDQESNCTSKGKGQSKALHDTMGVDETKLLVNLWVENHERLESKDARKTWTKIVDEHYKKNRTVDKCKRRMKYLLEKYKERKDWNKKQSGGNLWRSPFYDELDALLGTRDVISFQHVEEVQADSPKAVDNTSSEGTSTKSSPSSDTGTGSQKRKDRKRKRGPGREESEDESKVMKSLTEQGEKITDVISKMQETQSKQLEMMGSFMDAMVKMMSQSK